MDKKQGKTKKTTIYDIARELGISTATVSRVLSNSGYPVKEELRKRILESAEKMNYSLNIVGRMLKKNISLDIGVIIPTISNPFYSQLILGIELEARKKGYSILLCNSLRDTNIEKNYIDSLYQKQIKGIIISSIDENPEYIKRVRDAGVKIVMLDQNTGVPDCGGVGFQYKKAGFMAAEYLISMGHTNIAFLSSPLARKSRNEIADGYRSAILRHGLDYNGTNVIASLLEGESECGTYEFENGKQLARRFLALERRPTAIFAGNDMTAFGIIQELINNGINVPEDVSVIGLDNIEAASMVNPPLTTVNHPAFETGRIACSMLLESMDNDSYQASFVKLEPTLVIRKSVHKL